MTDYADLIELLRAKRVAVIHYNSSGITSQQLAPDPECGAAADAIEALIKERDEIASAIGTVRFMDPPDGGDVSLAEQIRRMSAENANLQEALRATLPWLTSYPGGGAMNCYEKARAALSAD